MLIFWGFFFSVIGMAFFVYGKRAAEFIFLIFGALLMVFPYLVKSSLLMVVLGVGFIAAPIILRRLE